MREVNNLKSNMKADKFCFKLALATGICIATSISASAVIAYQNPVGDYANRTGLGVWNVGMEFTVGSLPVAITGLGAFDNAQDGFSQPVQVGIYRVGDQSLVLSTTFSGSSDTLIDGSRFQDTEITVLSPNTAYMIVAAGYGGLDTTREHFLSEGQPNAVDITTDTDNGAIVLGENYYSYSSTLQYPTILAGEAGVPNWAAGTFDFTPVPEASSFAVAGVGLLGLVYVGRCVAQRRKTAA